MRRFIWIFKTLNQTSAFVCIRHFVDVAITNIHSREHADVFLPTRKPIRGLETARIQCSKLCEFLFLLS